MSTKCLLVYSLTSKRPDTIWVRARSHLARVGGRVGLSLFCLVCLVCLVTIKVPGQEHCQHIKMQKRQIYRSQPWKAGDPVDK